MKLDRPNNFVLLASMYHARQLQHVLQQKVSDCAPELFSKERNGEWGLSRCSVAGI